MAKFTAATTHQNAPRATSYALRATRYEPVLCGDLPAIRNGSCGCHGPPSCNLARQPAGRPPCQSGTDKHPSGHPLPSMVFRLEDEQPTLSRGWCPMRHPALGKTKVDVRQGSRAPRPQVRKCCTRTAGAGQSQVPSAPNWTSTRWTECRRRGRSLRHARPSDRID